MKQRSTHKIEKDLKRELKHRAWLEHFELPKGYKTISHVEGSIAKSVKKMADNWKEIWSKKTIKNLSDISLEQLILADGFDTGVGSYNQFQWKEMVADIIQRTALTKDDNILELGCGSGAFLYAMNEIVEANFYGIDYSDSLIQVANKAIPNGHFITDEVIHKNFGSISFDLVLSHSVFHYFPSIEYSEKVLENWCSKVKKNGFLVLLDINDAEFEANYHSERSKEYSSIEEYESNYKDLDHIFFEKKSLCNFLKSIGMKEIDFFPHCISSYGNSKFRFNLICRR